MLTLFSIASETEAHPGAEVELGNSLQHAVMMVTSVILGILIATIGMIGAFVAVF